MRAHDQTAFIDFAIAVHSLNDFRTPKIRKLQADFNTNSLLPPPIDSSALLQVS